MRMLIGAKPVRGKYPAAQVEQEITDLEPENGITAAVLHNVMVQRNVQVIYRVPPEKITDAMLTSVKMDKVAV